MYLSAFANATQLLEEPHNSGRFHGNQAHKIIERICKESMTMKTFSHQNSNTKGKTLMNFVKTVSLFKVQGNKYMHKSF